MGLKYVVGVLVQNFGTSITSAPLGCIAGSRQRIANETLKIHGVFMFGGTAECTCKSQKMGFKKVKVQPRGQSATGGVQKTSHMLVPIIRLKLIRDEDAAFAYYFLPGFQTKRPIFDPGVKILKFYQGYLGASTTTYIQQINLLLVKSN